MQPGLFHDPRKGGEAVRNSVNGSDASAYAAEAAHALPTFVEKVRDLIGADAWRASGAALRLGTADDRRVRLYAPTFKHCQHLENRVGARRLRALWADADVENRLLILSPEPSPENQDRAAGEFAEPNKAATASRPARRGQQVSSATTQQATFDNFIVGDANRYAATAARAVCGVEEAPFRLVVIYGEYGMGKSHLLMAIENEANVQCGEGAALYFTSDRFRAEFVKALGSKSALAFKDEVRSGRILLIDDLHLLEGSAKSQIELFHAINDVLTAGGQVVIASRVPVEELPDLDARLRARLTGCASFEIDKPDQPLRRRILERMVADNPAARRSGAVPGDVIDFIASAVVGTPRELHGALSSVLVQTVLANRPLTLDTAKEALQDKLIAASRRITVDEIQKCVAAYHGMKVSDLLAKRRSQHIVRPRQQAMFLCKELTTRSYPDIAKRFGGMDHTTVIHAVKRIATLCEGDPVVRSDIEQLRRLLRQHQQHPPQR